jgi:hypothetical protein
MDFQINYMLYNVDVWKCGGIAPSFLASTLDRVEWSASRPTPLSLYAWRKTPSTHCIGSCIGPRRIREDTVINTNDFHTTV